MKYTFPKLELSLLALVTATPETGGIHLQKAAESLWTYYVPRSARSISMFRTAAQIRSTARLR